MDERLDIQERFGFRGPSQKIGRLVVKGVKNFAMPNIIAGKEIVRELLQEEVTAENMAKEIEDLLKNEN